MLPQLKSTRALRTAEFLVFASIAAVIAIPIYIILARGNLFEVLREYYGVLILAIFTAIFPLWYLTLFGNTPFERLRRNRYGESAGLVSESPISQAIRRTPEWVVFAIIALIVAARSIVGFIIEYRDWLQILKFFYLDILFAIVIAIFPFLHMLTFGITIRQRIAQRRVHPIIREPLGLGGELSKGIDATSSKSAGDGAEPRADAVLQSYLVKSREIADGLYTRAGVYLILGVLIAFSGLFFFYTQTAKTLPSQVGQAGPPAQPTQKAEASATSAAMGVLASRVADLLPRFGILFFIEFVAFFFLRQYRGAMDEFRYFEAVKRYREETFALICLLREAGSVDTAKLIDSKVLFSSVAGVSPPPASGLLEAGSLSKEEISILEKVVGAISARKAG